jgi:VanZ like family
VDSLTTTRDDAAPATAPVPAAATKAAMIVRFALATTWTLVIMVLCWTPRYIVQEVEEGSSWFAIPNLDKVIHWGIFVVFAVLWLRTVNSRRRYAWVALGGLALAVITELVQTIPAINRNAGLDDAITDLIGVAIGLAVARWSEPSLSWIESRLLRPFGG